MYFANSHEILSKCLDLKLARRTTHLTSQSTSQTLWQVSRLMTHQYQMRSPLVLMHYSLGGLRLLVVCSKNTILLSSISNHDGASRPWSQTKARSIPSTPHNPFQSCWPIRQTR